MSYEPRTTRPNDGDPYWTKTTYGGYNEQILGNPVNRAWSGSVLPNCTGYVHGRWMELGNQPYDYDPSILPWGNASTYYGNSSAEKGQDPRLGACMVWGVGAGHVAIVEEIIDNDTVITSESDYGGGSGGTVFVTRTRHRGWNWGYYSGYSRAFLGFLYHPNITPVEPTYTLTVDGGIPTSAAGKEGDIVQLTVDKTKIPEGYTFWKWELNGGGTLTGDILNRTITYVFGNTNATVTVKYKLLPKGMNLLFYLSPPFYRRN